LGRVYTRHLFFSYFDISGLPLGHQLQYIFLTTLIIVVGPHRQCNLYFFTANSACFTLSPFLYIFCYELCIEYVIYIPVSIHISPTLSKECTDCLNWAVIENLGHEVLRCGKLAIGGRAETCHEVAVNSRMPQGNFPIARLTSFHPPPVHLDGIQLTVKFG
jgi:hypothetical protein